MKRIIAVVALVMLWTSIVFAEANWVNTIDENKWVDMNSIKVMQVDYDEIVKANVKHQHKSGGFLLETLLINKNTKEYCLVSYELYDAKGDIKSKDSFDPKDKRYWFDGDNESNEILKRVQ